MLAAFADFEREIIAARIAETRVYLKQHGQRLAGRLPFGYDADPISKQLIRNNVEARRVRAIFRRAASRTIENQAQSCRFDSPTHDYGVENRVCEKNLVYDIERRVFSDVTKAIHR